MKKIRPGNGNGVHSSYVVSLRRKRLNRGVDVERIWLSKGVEQQFSGQRTAGKKV
jgi:hypothetical protein